MCTNGEGLEVRIIFALFVHVHIHVVAIYRYIYTLSQWYSLFLRQLLSVLQLSTVLCKCFFFLQVPFEVATTNQMRKILIEARSLRAAPVQYQRETSKESRLCKICMDNTINTIILPCGHQVSDSSCVSTLYMCMCIYMYVCMYMGQSGQVVLWCP